MRSRLKRGLFTVLTVVCAVGAVYFGTMYWKIQKEYHQGEADLKLVGEIRGEAPRILSEEQKNAMDEASRRAEEEREIEEKREGYERLKTQNQDMIGWVRVEGSPIDYPVMQTPEEPDYYLRRGFDHKYSVYGMVYMDAACDLDGDCNNYILYGHHMKNGTMFASLEKYTSEDYYKEHPYLTFDTLEETGTYEIVGAFKLMADQVDADFAYKLAAQTEQDYDGLLRYIKENGFYDTGVTARWPEQLVTLATCEYTQKNGRLIVVARKIDR